MSYTSVIIGVGKGGDARGGCHSIGYAHANTYLYSDRCELIGGVDLNEENLGRYLDYYKLPKENGFTSHKEMLAALKPDIVSIATYASSHLPILRDCVAAGIKAIWMEKPMCLSMDEGREMEALCRQNGVLLVANHYRRTLDCFVQAKALIDQGAIGQSISFLAGVDGWELMEWGAHWLDMFRFFAGDQPAVSVMGQVRCSGDRKLYGHILEEHGLAYVTFEDGTRGILEGGKKPNGEFEIRISGEDGFIDILGDGCLRLLNKDGETFVETTSTPHLEKKHGDGSEGNCFDALIDSLTEWMDGGPVSSLGIENALLSSELYLAAYESAARGDLVELPLTGQSEFPLNRVAEKNN
jgi:predicted dehydrogenase